MPNYILVYLGGEKPASAEEGKQHYAKYTEWLKTLGDSVISPANPFKDTHTVHSDRSVVAGSATTMSGFTIIQAETIEAALEVAKTCPFLDVNGRLEVSELMDMPAQK